MITLILHHAHAHYLNCAIARAYAIPCYGDSQHHQRCVQARLDLAKYLQEGRNEHAGPAKKPCYSCRHSAQLCASMYPESFDELAPHVPLMIACMHGLSCLSRT